MSARKVMQNKLPGGRCRTCQKPLVIGETIVWMPRDDGRRGGRAYHPACEPGATPDAPVVPVPDGNGDMPHDDVPPIIDAKPAPVTPLDAITPLTDEIWRRIEARVKAAIPATPTPGEPQRIEHHVLIEENDTPPVVLDHAHPLTATFLTLLTTGKRNVYLHGKPGAGKSYVAQQIAAVLHGGIPFESLSLCPMSMPSLIMGYMDVQGRYVESAFRRIYEHGGVLIIDEADNANPNLLASLNDALANGTCGFPDKQITRHPHCYVVTTGNTSGYGGDEAFPDRQMLDAAFRSRFRFLAWSYDADHERAIAWAMDSANIDAIDAWCTWVHAVRAWADKYNPSFQQATPRAVYEGVTLLGRLAPADIAESVLFQGCDTALRARIIEACPLPLIPVAA